MEPSPMTEDSRNPIPEAEPERLRAVRDHAILDTAPELEFDALARVAAHAFATPIALVAMMDSDRLWFKSRLGVDLPQLDRRIAFCAHAIMRPHEPLVVEDLRTDARFSANPLVVDAPHIRFYAGAPIVDPAGLALGTIAVIDARPRTFADAQREALMDLSTLVMTALQNRRRALDMERLARTDYLTGIANRAQFDMTVGAELNQARRTGSMFCVLLMDLDGFKAVNDRFGHAAGDEVLREVARRVSQEVRQGDLLARIGGDEFAVVVRQGDAETAAALSHRIAQAMRQPIALRSGDAIAVGMSIGVAPFTDGASSASMLVAQADKGLYEAKRQLPSPGRG